MSWWTGRWTAAMIETWITIPFWLSVSKAKMKIDLLLLYFGQEGFPYWNQAVCWPHGKGRVRFGISFLVSNNPELKRVSYMDGWIFIRLLLRVSTWNAKTNYCILVGKNFNAEIGRFVGLAEKANDIWVPHPVTFSFSKNFEELRQYLLLCVSTLKAKTDRPLLHICRSAWITMPT